MKNLQPADCLNRIDKIYRQAWKSDAVCSAGTQAECAIWWRQVPPWPGQRLGVIGSLAASGSGPARQVLNAACSRLRKQDCTLVIGPMEGSTWHQYRCIVEPGTAPPFFMEPQQPAEWPEYFLASGFSVCARYSSRVQTRMLIEDPRLARTEQYMRAQGVDIRVLDQSRADAELDGIHGVINAAFHSGFLYTDIPQQLFRELYRPMLEIVDRRLVLLAAHKGNIVGFVFGVPDLLEAVHRKRATTLIVKTLAVLPARRYRGLGKLLWARLCRDAVSYGYERAINAFMYDRGPSVSLSYHLSTPLRAYALFARRLV